MTKPEITYHICWYDKQEYDITDCERRRRSAKIYEERGKELPMPQCLKCTEEMCEPGRADSNFGRYCRRCGVSIAGTSHQTKYCRPCAKANESERLVRKNKLFIARRRAKRLAGKK